MKIYKLKDGLQAIKDAWFYGEDILIMPWYQNSILVANNQSEKCYEEGVLDFRYRTFPGEKIYVKKSDFCDVDEYLNHLESSLIDMAENISTDPDNKKRRLGYLYLSQLAFAIREKITLEEMYATIDDINAAKQKVDDFVEEYDAVERIYCDYHTDRELTFEDHVVINLTGDLDGGYHFCNEVCAQRFILSGKLT